MLRELSSRRRSFLFQIPGRHKSSWTKHALRSTATDDANRPLPIHQTVCVLGPRVPRPDRKHSFTHPSAQVVSRMTTHLLRSVTRPRPIGVLSKKMRIVEVGRFGKQAQVVVYPRWRILLTKSSTSDSAEDRLPALCQASSLALSKCTTIRKSHTHTALHECLSLKLDTSGSCPDFIPSHIIYIYIPPAAVQSGHAPVVNHRDGHCRLLAQVLG